MLEFSCHIGSLVHKTLMSGLEKSIFFNYWCLLFYGDKNRSVIQTTDTNKEIIFYCQRKRETSQINFKDRRTFINNIDYDFGTAIVLSFDLKASIGINLQQYLA